MFGSNSAVLHANTAHFWELETPEFISPGENNLFHRRTRTAYMYVYNGRLAWYNVVLTPRIRSTVKQSTGANWPHRWLQQSTNTHTIRAQKSVTRNKKYNQIITYRPNWLYCTLEWYMELTIRYSTSKQADMTVLYSLTMTTKATFCHLPTTCFHCTNNTLRLSLLSSLKLRQTKYTTDDSCDG